MSNQSPRRHGGALIIDGQTVIINLGKPPKTTKFGDLADIVVQSVLSAGEKFDLPSILFDIYYTTSKMVYTIEENNMKKLS